MRWLHGAAVSSVAATALAATLAAQSGPDLVTRYREANGPRILRDFATLLTYPNRARDTADIERAALTKRRISSCPLMPGATSTPRETSTP